MNEPYTSVSVGSDGKPYVSGPGKANHFHSGHVYPNYRLSTPKDADAAALIANEAFKQGYALAQRDFRKVLGL